MLMTKRDINQQDFKIFDLHFVNNFHSLEAVDHVSKKKFK